MADLKSTMRSRGGWAIGLAVACTTTGCEAPFLGGVEPPGLRNVSDLEESFSIRRYEAAFDCTVAPTGAASLRLSALRAPVVFPARSGETVWLASGRSTEFVASDAGGRGRDSGLAVGSSVCGAAVVSSGRLRSSLLVTWDLRELEERDFLTSDGTADEQGTVPAGKVYVERFGEELRPSPGRGMFVREWRADEALP
jgi:hypothetical protein